MVIRPNFDFLNKIYFSGTLCGPPRPLKLRQSLTVSAYVATKAIIRMSFSVKKISLGRSFQNIIIEVLCAYEDGTFVCQKCRKRFSWPCDFLS